MLCNQEASSLKCQHQHNSNINKSRNNVYALLSILTVTAMQQISYPPKPVLQGGRVYSTKVAPRLFFFTSGYHNA